MFQFGGSWSFVWGDKPTKAPVVTGLSAAQLSHTEFIPLEC